MLIIYIVPKERLLREYQATTGEVEETRYVGRKLKFKRDAFVRFTVDISRKRTRAWANRQLEPIGLQLRPLYGDVIHNMSVVTFARDDREIGEILGSEVWFARFNHTNELFGDGVSLEINMDLVHQLSIPEKGDLFNILGIQAKRMLSASYRHKNKPSPTLNVEWINPRPLDETYVGGFVRALKGER